MRFGFLALLGMLAVMVTSPRAENVTRYLSVVDDLPLMQSIQEIGEGVVFSSREGRIAEALARGSVDEAQVLAFYSATLPQLGWQEIDSHHFVREGEMLTLIFARHVKLLEVRFALKPVGK